MAAQAQQGGVTGARLSEATARYDHGVLGNGVEWGALDLTLRDCGEGAEAMLAAAVSSPFA